MIPTWKIKFSSVVLLAAAGANAVAAEGQKLSAQEFFSQSRSSLLLVLTSMALLIAALATSWALRLRRRAQTSAAGEAEAGSLLETLLENSTDHVYFKDLQSRFVRCSASLKKLFPDMDLSSLCGKTDFELFTPEHAQQAFEDEQRIIRTGEPLIGKLEKETHADGRITWALSTKLPWRGERGNIIGTFGISKDVTAIVETEARLASEKELLHTLLENLPDAIYFKNRESRFLRLSRAKVARTLEMEIDRHRAENPGAAQLPPHLLSEEKFAEHITGKSDFDIYSEERARSAYEDEQEIMRTGKPVIDKIEHATLPNGKIISCLTTKMPWRDKNGNIIGTFGLSRDVTQRLKLESDLRQAHKMEVIGRMAAGVAHEFNNILTIIQGEVGLLQTAPNLSAEKQRTLLNQIMQTSQRAAAITRQLLAYSRQQVLQPHRLDLSIVVASTKEMLRPLIGKKFEFQFACAHGLPAVLVEEVGVQQILTNLVLNARDAMTGGGVIRIETGFSVLDRAALVSNREARAGRFVWLSVADSGCGMSPEILARIFDPFFTTKDVGKGTGLGLATIHGIVKQHAGWIDVASEVGRGSTFKIFFPECATPPVPPANGNGATTKPLWSELGWTPPQKELASIS